MGQDTQVMVAAPAQLILPFLSTAAVSTTTKKDGTIGISGAQVMVCINDVWINLN